jgi:hypothetical protein
VVVVVVGATVVVVLGAELVVVVSGGVVVVSGLDVEVVVMAAVVVVLGNVGIDVVLASVDGEQAAESSAIPSARRVNFLRLIPLDHKFVWSTPEGYHWSPANRVMNSS